MTVHKKEWMFRRMVIRAATRKLRPEGVGVRRADHQETPLSNDEIFIGVKYGFISISPFVSIAAQDKVTA